MDAEPTRKVTVNLHADVVGSRRRVQVPGCRVVDVDLDPVETFEFSLTFIHKRSAEYGVLLANTAETSPAAYSMQLEVHDMLQTFPILSAAFENQN